jgi:hypothetical protein
MSQFTYADYASVVAKAQQGSNSQKVGYFRLANDGDEALVRINCSKVDELQFASVHTISTEGKWLKVSCMNPLGSYTDGCELCMAAKAGNKAVSTANKRVFIQMLVSYKDKSTGAWSDAQPVIWERPAGFSRELANKLRDYGDLRQVLLKITRNGAAGDMKTTYSLDYAVPTVFRPEMIPMDFSAFTNFNIAKHSYWEKTPEEIHTFVTTGKFPDVQTAQADPMPVLPGDPNGLTVNTNTVTPVVQVAEPVAPVTPTPTTWTGNTVESTPTPAPTTSRDFSGAKFAF